MMCLEMARVNVPLESAGTDSDVGDDSGLAALDFDDLVNQPLGSDDVSFSFDELSSVDTRGRVIRVREQLVRQRLLSPRLKF